MHQPDIISVAAEARGSGTPAARRPRADALLLDEVMRDLDKAGRSDVYRVICGLAGTGKRSS